MALAVFELTFVAATVVVVQYAFAVKLAVRIELTLIGADVGKMMGRIFTQLAMLPPINLRTQNYNLKLEASRNTHILIIYCFSISVAFYRNEHLPAPKTRQHITCKCSTKQIFCIFHSTEFFYEFCDCFVLLLKSIESQKGKEKEEKENAMRI